MNTSNETEGLTKLGTTQSFQYDSPESSIIEAFPNPSDKDYEIALISEEFTSLCPKTGQPDYGEIRINYWPADRCIESKSWKLYLCSFRGYKGFMEKIVNKIADDIITAIKPKFVTVVGKFAARGGVSIEVQVIRHIDGNSHATTHYEFDKQTGRS